MPVSCFCGRLPSVCHCPRTNIYRPGRAGPDVYKPLSAMTQVGADRGAMSLASLGRGPFVARSGLTRPVGILESLNMGFLIAAHPKLLFRIPLS